MHRRLIQARRLALGAGALLLAACTDQELTQPEPIAPPGETVRARIACQADVAAGTLRCAEPATGGARANVTLGGQHVYVRMLSANPSYAGGVFRFDASVQNLLAQRMGTPDGSTVYGMKVFFEQPPTATEGSGDVTVLNPDGTDGAFTGSNQIYYHYPEILEPRGTSQPRSWQFGVSAGVTRFAFSVYVETQLPVEQGLLRWEKVMGQAASTHDLWWDSSRDPAPTVFHAVHAISDNSVFAVGNYGSILHYDGKSWAAMPGDRNWWMRDVWGADPRNVYAVGDGGLIVKYDGNRWTQRVSGTAVPLTSVWGTSATDVVAVGRQWNASTSQFDAVVLRTTDGGASWTVRVSPDEWFGHLHGLAGSTTLFATGGLRDAATGTWTNGILRSDDAGDTWRLINTTSLQGGLHIWAASTSEIYAVSTRDNPTEFYNEGVLVRTKDGGATWTTSIIRYPRETELTGISGTSGSNVFIVGRQMNYDYWQGLLLRSTNGGASWTPTVLPQPYQSEVNAVSVTGTGTAYAVGSPGLITRFSGGRWSTMEGATEPDSRLEGIWSPDGSTVFTVGTRRTAAGLGRVDSTIVLRSGDGGTNWSTVFSQPASSMSQLRGVWGSSTSDVYAVGTRRNPGTGYDEGVILHTTDGGASWTTTVSAPSSHRRLHAIWGSDASNVFAVGVQSGASIYLPRPVILRSRDGGATWTELTLSGFGAFTSVWGTSASEIYAAGSDGNGYTYVLMSRDGGQTWMSKDLALQGGSTSEGTGQRTLSAIWGTGQDIFAVGTQQNYVTTGGRTEGVILRSRDGGASWTETVPPHPSIRSFHAVAGRSASEVYVVGTGGTLLHYDGTSWKEMSSGTMANLGSVTMSASGRAFAAGERMTVLRGTR